MSRSKTWRDEHRSSADETMSDGHPRSVPSMPTSASVSHSRTSRTDTKSAADEMLRASLSGGDVLPASSASVSRSALRGDKKPMIDDSTRAPVSHSALPYPTSASVSKSWLKGEMKPSKDDGLRSAPAPARGIPSDSSSTLIPTPPPPYATTVDSEKLRKDELQEEIKKANAEASQRKTAGLFREACSTDLLFLIDTTSSMTPYLDAAKDQVRSIVNDIKATFLKEAQVRIAVVSYKDHNNYRNIEFLDFTPSAEVVISFLDTLSASGGADVPEDVLGGIQQTLDATWKQQTRCIVHIADAPPHGSSNHDLGEGADSYYKEGSEPHGLKYGPLFKKLVQLKINYALLRINYSTDRMALNFADVYGYDNAKLLTVNKYFERVKRSKAGGRTFQQSAQAMLPQFEEQALGTTYNKLRHLVLNSVVTSVSRTAGRLTLSLEREAAKPKPKMMSGLSAIHESDDGYSLTRTHDGVSSLKVTSLETSPPQWDTPGWLDETLEVEGFCPAIVVHDADTLSDMMFEDEKIRLSVTELTIHTRSKPFAAGAVRRAYYARSAASTNRFVVKSFIKAGHTRADVAEDMRMQALCKAFALEFNGLLKIADDPLDFIVTSCLSKKGRRVECLSLEPFIDGEYIKYNNNGGWINGDLADDPLCQMAQAFSHFSFERSWGRFLVNDLQGVGRVFTDPSIQTQDPERFKLNDTNLGQEGFKFFFATHKCNTFCKHLELESNGQMFITGTFKFRERWPVMDPTVCCSNKLCRRIIRLATAHSSDKFPSHHWCDACWSQLQDSVVECVCIEPGESHEFEVSRFFHESQGEIAPQKCPSHREKNPWKSTPGVVGGGIYSMMKVTESNGTIAGRGW